MLSALFVFRLEKSINWPILKCVQIITSIEVRCSSYHVKDDITSFTDVWNNNNNNKQHSNFQLIGCSKADAQIKCETFTIGIFQFTSFSLCVKSVYNFTQTNIENSILMSDNLLSLSFSANLKSYWLFQCVLGGWIEWKSLVTLRCIVFFSLLLL